MAGGDLAAAAAPFLWACRAVGVGPFHWQAPACVHEPRLRHSRPRRLVAVWRPARLYGCVAMLAQLLAVPVLLGSPRESGVPDYKRLTVLVDTLCFLAHFLTAVLVLFQINVLHTQKLQELMQLVGELHCALYGTDTKLLRRVRLTCVLELLGIMLMVCALITRDFDVYSNVTDAKFVYWTTAYKFAFVVGLLCTNFYMNMAIMLYLYLKKMNSVRALCAHGSDGVGRAGQWRWGVRRGVRQLTLRDVRRLHLALCSVVQRANSVFASIVCLETTSFQLFAGTVLFRAVLFLRSPPPAWHTDAGPWLMAAFVAQLLWKMAGVALGGEAVSVEARRLAWVVRRALVLGPGPVAWPGAVPGAGERRRELERFAAQLAACCAELRTAGGSRVGAGLLGAAAAGTVSYLLVMLQFRFSESPAAR